MTFQQGAVAGVAAFVASAINSAAGGGSFISFPALLAVGVAPITANATNNTAMWVGAFSSAGVLRSELEIARPALVKMLVVTALGSALGAIILTHTKGSQFVALIPWLLLVATSLFIAGPSITKRVRRMQTSPALETPLGLAGQFVISIYGGFFGAAASILMLALLGLLGLHDLRRANAFKMLLSTVVNGVAVVPFAIAGVIAWNYALVTSLCAVLGGFLGAGAVKRLPPRFVRGFVITVGVALTLYFFWKTGFAGSAPARG